MSEGLTSELISKWISFKLYPDMLEEPFFSPEVHINFTPSRFQVSGKKDVKNFLKDFFTQGNSDYSIDITSSAMDIKGDTLEEDMKVSVTSKTSTLNWLCSEELSYYNLSGRSVTFNMKMIFHFSNDLLLNVSTEWDPQELEECLMEEDETPVVQDKEKNLLDNEEKSIREDEKVLLEPEIKKEQAPSKASEEKYTPVENQDNTIVYQGEKRESGSYGIKGETSESDESVQKNKTEVGQDVAQLHSSMKATVDDIGEKTKNRTPEADRAEVDTLVDSEGSVDSHSPVLPNGIDSLINKFETKSPEKSLGTNKKPISKLASKSDSKLDKTKSSGVKTKVGAKNLTTQNKALSNSKSSLNISKPESQLKKSSTTDLKSSTRPKSLVRKEAPIISNLKASSKPKEVRPISNRSKLNTQSSEMSKSVVSSPSRSSNKSRQNTISSRSSKFSSPLKSSSASQLPTRKANVADSKTNPFSTVNHLTRPIIRSSLRARNLNTTFTIGNED